HQWDAGSGCLVDRRDGQGDRALSQELIRVFWLGARRGGRRVQREFFPSVAEKSGKPGLALADQLPSRARRFIPPGDAAYREAGWAKPWNGLQNRSMENPAGRQVLTPRGAMRP